MSATGHTPGPWHWDSDPVKGDPTGRVRFRVVATGKTITQLYYSSFEGGLTNAEADARLIATAPELLDALEFILRGMDGGHIKSAPFIDMSDPDAESLEIKHPAAVIRAVIVKAKGGA